MSMTNEKWLSGVAKSGEYNDLINKPTIVTDIDSDASEKSLASAKSVKLAYDKAKESLNKANESKTKIATSLNSMGVATDEKDTFDSLSEKIKTIKTGVNTDDATATAEKILTGNSAYVKGQKVDGSMKDISGSSNITHEQGNPTKVVLADDLFIANNTDGKRRISFRYAGDNGFITGNTLFAIEESKVAEKLGITPEKIVSGQNICGVNGTFSILGSARVVSLKDIDVESLEDVEEEDDYYNFKVNVGFKPRYVYVRYQRGNGKYVIYTLFNSGNVSVGSGKYDNGNTSSYLTESSIRSNLEILDDGFRCKHVYLYKTKIEYICSE